MTNDEQGDRRKVGTISEEKASPRRESSMSSVLHANGVLLATNVHDHGDEPGAFVAVWLIAGRNSTRIMQNRNPELLRQLAEQFASVVDQLNGIAEEIEAAPVEEPIHDEADDTHEYRAKGAE